MKCGVRKVFWNHTRLQAFGLKVWSVFYGQRLTKKVFDLVGDCRFRRLGSIFNVVWRGCKMSLFVEGLLEGYCIIKPFILNIFLIN